MTQPRPSYTYREMFEFLKVGSAQKVCRQDGNSAWIIEFLGDFYREVYDTKTWQVHYDLLSTEEVNAVMDRIALISPSVEEK